MRKPFYGLIALFAVLAALAACHSSSSRLSKKEFCQLYYDSMSRRFPQVKFAVVDERTISSSWDGKGARMFIDNAYASYEMSPDSLVPILQRYANSAEEVYNMDMSVKMENIVPVVRAASGLLEMKVLAAEAGAKKQVGMLHEAYNDELVICYAIDTKNNIRYLQDKDLETKKTYGQGSYSVSESLFKWDGKRFSKFEG